MSENNKISNYDEQVNCQSIRNLYSNYQKYQNDISFLRNKIIDLESNLVHEKNLKFIIERKLQKLSQDVEHYKMKNLIETQAVISNEMPIEIDFHNIYTVNEDIIKKNKSLELKINELENYCKDIENTNFDLERRMVELNCKIENLTEINQDLTKFIEEKKSEMLEANELKLRSNDLRDLLSHSNNDSDSSYHLSFAKIDELQVKCFNLEKENQKFRENHTNLLLLVEENSSLVNRIKSLENKLNEFDGAAMNTNADNHYDCNNESVADRKLRHLERENEILKAHQSNLLEKMTDVELEINCQAVKISELQEVNNMQKYLAEQKQREMEIKHNRLFYLTKECESYKKVLNQFTEQSNVTNENDVAALLECLGELYENIEAHKIGFEHQAKVLEQLTSVISTRIENFESSIHHNRMEMGDVVSGGDQKIIFDLEQQVKRLSAELEKKSQLIEKLDKFNYHTVNTAIGNETEEVTLEPEHYREMGFTKNADNQNPQEKGNIFQILTGKLLTTIQKIFGYTIEMGPNGYVSVHNCLTNDPLQLLEFNIDRGNEPVLIDNTYSLFLKNQLYCQSFPVLLAKLTIDLFDHRDDFMQ